MPESSNCLGGQAAGEKVGEVGVRGEVAFAVVRSR